MVGARISETREQVIFPMSGCGCICGELDFGQASEAKCLTTQKWKAPKMMVKRVPCSE